MKSNETSKSKFVYPDKLYARCENNKTLDISYAPQNMEAVEYTRTDAFIEKTEKWLKDHILEYVPEMNFGLWKTDPDYYTKHFIEDFKKYMEE